MHSVELSAKEGVRLRGIHHPPLNEPATGALTSIEICAGAGGQAIGLEMAGFEHAELIEIDANACNTLRLNRPAWKVYCGDLKDYIAEKHFLTHGTVSLVAGGVPCPPFSIAGKQLGVEDERNLFDEALELVRLVKPEAVMLENVKGLLEDGFLGYREHILGTLSAQGYWAEWRLLNASDYGVPQLRPRAVLVALKKGLEEGFSWPEPCNEPAPTVGEALLKLMDVNGWKGAHAWHKKAGDIAPTLVGGSKKHGGPDLGPTRARMAWAALGVDGKGIADAPPTPGFRGMPRLTVAMAAKIQGFPNDWKITGGKTAAYRQVGNAFPPPVARAVAEQIAKALAKAGSPRRPNGRSIIH
jgi:DNA (cytosine-5)-methyltransferase 1